MPSLTGGVTNIRKAFNDRAEQQIIDELTNAAKPIHVEYEDIESRGGIPVQSTNTYSGPPTERLVPVFRVPGGTVYRSRDEEVSPLDCELWPNSPYCSGLNAINPLDPVGVDVDVEISQGRAVVRIDPTLAWIKGPSGYLVFESDDAPPINDAPQGRTPPKEEWEYQRLSSAYSSSSCVYAVWIRTNSVVSGPSFYFGPVSGLVKKVTTAQGSDGGELTFMNTYIASRGQFNTSYANGRDLDGTIFRPNPNSQGRIVTGEIPSVSIDRIEKVNSAMWGPFNDPIANSRRTVYRNAILWNQNNCIEGKTPPFAPPPYSPRREPPKMSCRCKKEIAAVGRAVAAVMAEVIRLDECIQEIKDEQKEIAKVLAIDAFPVGRPLLTGDESFSLQTYPDYFDWIARNIDATAGQWPLEVEILDKKGEVQQIKLEDQSSAIYELYGALMAIAEDSDDAVNVAARAVTESVHTKVIALQNASMLESFKDFSGMRTTQEEGKVKLTVTPSAVGRDGVLENQEVDEFLKSSETNYRRYKAVKERDLMGMIDRILQGVEMIRNSFFRRFIPNGSKDFVLPGDLLSGNGAEGSNLNDAEWEKYKESLRKRKIQFDDDKSGGVND